MRTFDPAFEAELRSGVTTHCTCWRVTRTDGAALGFTDHDGAVAFDGVSHEPAGGFTGLEPRATRELSVDGAGVLGVLDSVRITEADLAAGLYDGAAVDVFRVNWRAPHVRGHLQSYTIAEVRRTGAGFTAELRGPTAKFDAARGRVYGRTCDARLGDARCGVDVTAPEHRAAGVVSAVVSSQRIIVTGLESFPPGRFSAGLIDWTTGANAGRPSELRAHGAGPEGVVLTLRHAPARSIVTGDAFTAVAGCDKTFATCRDVYGNTPNFRGFPHMPGDDRALGRFDV